MKSFVQRFFLTVLPGGWGARMKAESQAWRIRCCTCGTSQSVWDAGGIRWGATSRGKRTMIRCATCGRVRRAAVERSPE